MMNITEFYFPDKMPVNRISNDNPKLSLRYEDVDRTAQCYSLIDALFDMVHEMSAKEAEHIIEEIMWEINELDKRKR